MTVRKDWNEFYKGIRGLLFWVVGIILVVWLVNEAWYEYHRQIEIVALVALAAAAEVFDKMDWQAWAIILAALIWGYTYRRNRQRQEKIIAILLEISRKLE
jgi:hypothetical protein